MSDELKEKFNGLLELAQKEGNRNLQIVLHCYNGSKLLGNTGEMAIHVQEFSRKMISQIKIAKYEQDAQKN